MANRWGAYKSAKESTISKIESSLKLKDFTTSLPAIVQKDKQFCQKMHQTLLDSLSTSIREFSEKVEEEVKLNDHLDRLDKITDNQENVEKEGIWRPPRNPLDNQVNQGVGKKGKRGEMAQKKECRPTKLIMTSNIFVHF